MNFTLSIPGSKSILQRIMTLMALLRIDLDINNYNPCTDVLELEDALKAFGYEVSGEGTKRSFHYDGKVRTGMYHFHASGTAFRLFLAALASMENEQSTIIASETLIHRGYQPLVDALNQMNAKITLRGNEFQITGSKLKGSYVQMDGKISSQYVSALLLATVNMDSPLIIILPQDQVSLPYIDLTINILQSFGACICAKTGAVNVPFTKRGLESHQTRRLVLRGSLSAAKRSSIQLCPALVCQPPGWHFASKARSVKYNLTHQKRGFSLGLKDDSYIKVTPSTLSLPKEITIDPDASTLAWYIAKAVLGKKEQQIPFANVFPQADFAMLKIAQGMGASLEYIDGIIHIYPSSLKGGTSIDLKHCPDLMPILSILALFCAEPLTLIGVSRLQYKESNRILGITKALDLLNAQYQQTDDEVSIFPYRKQPPNVVLDTLGDHRLVMAFSLLADRYSSVELSEWDSLSKSVPAGFLPTDYSWNADDADCYDSL